MITYRDTELRPLLAALVDLRDGDFGGELDVAAEGCLGEIAVVVNQIAARKRHLRESFAGLRDGIVRRGDLGERLSAGSAKGGWEASAADVNAVVDALARSSADVGGVVAAVAAGDLSVRADLEPGGVRLRGDLRRRAQDANRMAAGLETFTAEITRLAREVGIEGHLGGRARTRGTAGEWREATEAVNVMAARLTAQVRDIAEVTTAVARGDLTRKVTIEADGELLELKHTVNAVVDRLSVFADEVTRVAREVGTEGRLGGQAQVQGVSGVWRDLTDAVNLMASNLTGQVRAIALVTTAVARGDLSMKITVESKGEILELARTINTMVDRLSALANEVTRVAREVGTEGRLGGQAQAAGASGTWKDLADNVNIMADNLTGQVRSISEVAEAVAKGDLSKRIDVDARGEIRVLKVAINTMVDTLSSFASEVTRVAREVGSEGRLGGQAEVEGVHGSWKQLTKSVNTLAGNLTTQVRAISAVASAVASGDLDRSIDVEARGEVAELTGNVNQMVANLRETTRTKAWLEGNLTRLAGLMQGHRDLVEVAELIMNELSPLVSAQYGAFFLARGEHEPVFELIAGYGHRGQAGVRPFFRPGEGLIGQAAVQKRRIIVDEAPPGYLMISSGLGGAAPAALVVLPILFEDDVLGVIELASFSRFSDVHLAFFDQFAHTIGVAINTVLANARTEELLQESRRLTDELQRQQQELKRSNAELEEKAALLSTSSRVKSDFLANVSHELRTPLNSLLILARLLADNTDGHLSEQEVEFASTIHAAGRDLLRLINDILDLAKVEAGRMDITPGRVPVRTLVDDVASTFRPLAAEKGLVFTVWIDPGVPEAIETDEKRATQILRNLLSNAVKFTHEGSVRLSVTRAGPSPQGEGVAFAVTDTGIGIRHESLGAVFSAFQQADPAAGESYGGTGLGLSISREIAGLLGGEISVASELGAGSTFTLRLPASGAESVTLEPPASSPAEVAKPVDGELIRRWRSRSDAQVLAGARVLIVDDDIRNVFALTHVLERVGMDVAFAENGREGLELLEADDTIGLVLLDVMMPEMDGYATVRAIRENPRLAALPVVALTAKAMRGDGDKVIAAGASDYVPKPVDLDHLLEIVRVRLLEREGMK